MVPTLIVIFLLSTCLILHAYFGYPATLAILQPLLGRASSRQDAAPRSVSLIIATANEQAKIDRKLENTLELAYSHIHEIIIALDAPTDGTEERVDAWIARHPNLIRKAVLPVKGGKEAAQFAAIQQSSGEILVFTDVATHLEPNTIDILAENFADPRVGAVDGMSTIRGHGSSEGLYLRYENKIREWESGLGGLVSMGGSLFAVRALIVKAPGGFATDLQSDFRTALMTRTMGFQTILDPRAIALFDDLSDPAKEFGRKHRTVVRGMNNFFHHLYLLNPFKYGLFSYQFFCHKLLKWLVPPLMALAMASNLALAILTESPLWLTLLGLQGVFYVIALAGYLWHMRHPLLKVPAFMLMSNLAIGKAWTSYLRGERFVSWTPSKR